MRKALLALSLAAVAGCGGMGASTQSLTASVEEPAKSIDLACCALLDSNNNTCAQWATANGTTITVKIYNDSIKWFNDNQTVYVDSCSFSLLPLGDTPDPPAGIENYLSCSAPPIPAGGSSDLTIAIPNSFIEQMWNLYQSVGLDVLAYQLTVDVHLRGEYSGTYDLTIPMVLDFANYPINGNPEDDLCNATTTTTAY